MNLDKDWSELKKIKNTLYWIKTFLLLPLTGHEDLSENWK